MKNFTFFLFLLIPIFSEAQLTVIIDKYPESTKDIFIAGDFNGWQPNHPNYKMILKDDKTYIITLDIKQSINFKFTQGSWTEVEQSKNNQDIPNRTFNSINEQDTIRLKIKSWKEKNKSKEQISTQSPQVKIIENFKIPQLGRERNIRIYLPKSYTKSKKAYPVLYMHDAQNLFDKKTAFMGEWEVDEILDKANLDLIVVGIDNSEERRVNEYMIYDDKKYGRGEGQLYLDFIANTLKPYIDKNYRTLKKAKHTGIMGASMGGLISHYAGLFYPEVFGKIGIYSPSFWINKEVYDLTQNKDFAKNAKVHLLLGDKEPKKHIVNPSKKIHDILQGKKISLRFEVIPKGEHSEWFWRQEFLDSVKWLFFEK